MMDQLMDTKNCIVCPTTRYGAGAGGVDGRGHSAKSIAVLIRKEPKLNPYRKLALSIQKLEALADEMAQLDRAYQLTRNCSTTRSIGSVCATHSGNLVGLKSAAIEQMGNS